MTEPVRCKTCGGIGYPPPPGKCQHPACPYNRDAGTPRPRLYTPQEIEQIRAGAKTAREDRQRKAQAGIWHAPMLTVEEVELDLKRRGIIPDHARRPS